MKKKVRTPWIEFFKTGRFYKYIEAIKEDEHLSNELKEKKEIPKKIHWVLTIYMIDGHKSTLITIKPDSEDFEGQHVFDEVLEWFQCSDNPSYIMWFNEDELKIFVRDKITEIQLIKKEKR